MHSSLALRHLAMATAARRKRWLSSCRHPCVGTERWPDTCAVRMYIQTGPYVHPDIRRLRCIYAVSAHAALASQCAAPKEANDHQASLFCDAILSRSACADSRGLSSCVPVAASRVLVPSRLRCLSSVSRLFDQPISSAVCPTPTFLGIWGSPVSHLALSSAPGLHSPPGVAHGRAELRLRLDAHS